MNKDQPPAGGQAATVEATGFTVPNMPRLSEDLTGLHTIWPGPVRDCKQKEAARAASEQR
jgi:hypothetical protein